jgi:DNA processing protein
LFFIVWLSIKFTFLVDVTTPCHHSNVTTISAVRSKMDDFIELLQRQGGDRLVVGQLSLLDSDKSVDSPRVISELESDLEQWRSTHGIHFAVVDDAEFPDQLRQVKGRPRFISWKGSLSDQDQFGVSIVGSRRATDEGRTTAREFASALAKEGITILSGLAAGIDTEAHQAALEVNGRTVAVIGTGLLHSYPPQNSELQKTISEKGLVVSRFFPDAGPTQYSFPLRNAVMSAYGAATLVIEAAPNSGALIQAKKSFEQERLTFFHKNLQSEEWAVQFAREFQINFIESPEDLIQRLRTKKR